MRELTSLLGDLGMPNVTPAEIAYFMVSPKQHYNMQ